MQKIHGFGLFNRKYLSRSFKDHHQLCIKLRKTIRFIYADECGVLRCKGRIGHANRSSDTVNPALLPTHHHLTNLVIKEVRSKMMHGGVASMLTAMWENYWIPREREVVKGFIPHCVVCTKHAGKPFPFFTPPSLPEVRVDDGPPWTNTGVDYCKGNITFYDSHLMKCEGNKLCA